MNEKKSYLLVVDDVEYEVFQFGNGEILFNDIWYQVIPSHTEDCDGHNWPYPETLPETRIKALIARELIFAMNMVWCSMMTGEYCIEGQDPNIEHIVKVIPVSLVTK